MRCEKGICFVLSAALVLCLCGCAGSAPAGENSYGQSGRPPVQAAEEKADPPAESEKPPVQAAEEKTDPPAESEKPPAQTAAESGKSTAAPEQGSEIDIDGTEESVPTAAYATAAPKPTEPPARYQAPEFADSVFHESKAEGRDGALIDLSAAEYGYVAVSAVADVRLKVQVLKGDEKYSYDIANDGTPSAYPIQLGDGDYTFRVLRNVPSKGASKYTVVYSVDKKVKLKDEFQPFLRPNDHVNYNKDSKCVIKAAKLAKDAEDGVGVVAAVYDYICSNVKYDKQKAKDVQDGKMAGYLPVPDDIMDSGKGICFDYAALAAAMLRSQGIPTKMICGYVSPDDVYHAWNMFYTEETGWVTVEFKVKSGVWTRLDLTFSAGGADSTFIGDGTNYADVYIY